MNSGWHELTEITKNRDFFISKVHIKESDISIEGKFELPPLAKLSFEDQVFIAEFVRAHGSIKQMEQSFGVSYPTIKSRLNQIASKLQLVEVRKLKSTDEILTQLEEGTIDASEALERLNT